jgi:ribosomal protein S18 acetylase RimI-like enzyme
MRQPYLYDRLQMTQKTIEPDEQQGIHMGTSLIHRHIDHADHERVVELLVNYRAATRVDVYPTAWRLRLLLTSRVWEPTRDTQLWEDVSRQMVGFAMLWRRRSDDPHLILNRCIHPEHTTGDLIRQMLAWANQRATALAAERATQLTLYASPLDPRICSDGELDSFGFVKISNHSEVYNVYFSRPLHQAIPAPTLPQGYILRSLRDDELDAYEGLFGFTAVSAQHRRELLASDEYSHLLIVDPAGALAAYCECSICRLEWAHSSQRIGWIDYVGARPDQQRRGLGRAILLASLDRLRRWGAHTAQLLTISSNTPAIALYRSTGFTQVEIPEAPGYEKQIGRKQGFA